jgi:hypothetical protein
MHAILTHQTREELVVPEQPSRVAYLFASGAIQVKLNLPEFNLSSADSLQYETT